MQSSYMNINTSESYEDVKEETFSMNYQLNYSNSLEMVEGGWKIIFGTGTNVSQLSGGPFKNPQQLLDIHGHFREIPLPCHEHLVNGSNYVGELHLVHFDTKWNHTPSRSIETPLNYKAIICILLKEGNEHDELAKVTKALSSSSDRSMGAKIPLGSDINIDILKLFPKELKYWMYDEDKINKEDGTKEGETSWIVFKNPIQISKAQIEILRPFYKEKTIVIREGEARICTPEE